QAGSGAPGLRAFRSAQEFFRTYHRRLGDIEPRAVYGCGCVSGEANQEPAMTYEAIGFQLEASSDAPSFLDTTAPVVAHAVVIGLARPLMLAGFEMLLRRMPALRLAAREETFAALVDACARAGDCIAVFDPFHTGRTLREVVGALRERAP